MSLVQVSGIGRHGKGKQKIKKALQKRGKLFVKFNPATVSARNSFLLLVKLNVFNLGKRLVQMILKMLLKKLFRKW